MTKITLRLSLVLACLSCAGGQCTAQGPTSLSRLQAVELRCEYLVNPLGIDQTAPRLSWRIESSERGARQTAYRVLVASDRELIDRNEGNLWDSGRVESSETVNIVYSGRPLRSREVCLWKVQVWGQPGNLQFSESVVAHWSMGLLNESDWQANFISYRDDSPVFADRDSLYLPPAYQYRKEFPTTSSPIRRATIYATALGIYELYLNGTRVGDEYFAPGWTDYRQRAYYRAYDVTNMLNEGDNALGAWVADGWYAGYIGFGLLTGIGTERMGRFTYGRTPSVMAQLEIEYEDGTRSIVGTDTSWKVTGAGPIREADFLMGESYDARRELPGWSTVTCDDSAWQEAILAEENGHPSATFYQFRNPTKEREQLEVRGEPVDLGFRRPRLEAFPGVPVRVTQEMAPVEVVEVAKGQYLYDLGQNFAGTIRLTIQGVAGTEVTLRYGEMLYPDGRLMTENLRKARATDRYILDGDPAGETYIPRFTFHGFRYVEATVEAPAKVTEAPLVTGLVLHSDTPMTSTFECSDPMVNRLFKNIVWTQRANFIDLPTDCPQRDERFGWTGDAQVYIGTAAYNADVAAFYTKWLRELMESQRPSGTFPGYAPFPFQHGWDFGTAWADAGVICPWTVWQAYGDTRVIESCWEPMTRFMQWRKNTSRDFLGVAQGNPWGDWLAQGAETPLEYIDTIYFAISTRMMSQMAAAIGRDDEATEYRSQLAHIATAFRQKYLQEDGSLTVNTQTAYALALFADLIPHDQRHASGQKLADLIHDNGNRMSTGFLGTRPLLPVLSSVGQHDLAVFLFQSRAFPSWGYEVEQGATTIWERWDSYTKEDGFGRHNAAMNSFAHYSFGAVCEWMFNTLAGVRPRDPGYGHMIIQPRPAAPGSNEERQVIHWLNASYNSLRGRIVSNWRIDQDRFDLEVEIPANTTATVILPASDESRITESGQPLSQALGVQLVRMSGDRAILLVDSGKYRFSSAGAIRPARRSFKTSPPPDLSVNPESIDLQNARMIARWNFDQAAFVREQLRVTNLNLERRDTTTVLTSVGSDPQLEFDLVSPATGPLVVLVEARVRKPTTTEFFWAGTGEDYTAIASHSRKLNASHDVKQYLFRVGGGQPIARLRWDPFPNDGELEIHSLALYAMEE